jgi:hypothetical protein
MNTTLSIPKIVEFKEEINSLIQQVRLDPIPGSSQESLLRRLMTYYKRIKEETYNAHNAKSESDSLDSDFITSSSDEDLFTIDKDSEEHEMRMQRHLLGLSHTGNSDPGDDYMFDEPVPEGVPIPKSMTQPPRPANDVPKIMDDYDPHKRFSDLYFDFSSEDVTPSAPNTVTDHADSSVDPRDYYEEDCEDVDIMRNRLSELTASGTSLRNNSPPLPPWLRSHWSRERDDRENLEKIRKWSYLDVEKDSDVKTECINDSNTIISEPTSLINRSNKIAFVNDCFESDIMITLIEQSSIPVQEVISVDIVKAQEA